MMGERERLTFMRVVNDRLSEGNYLLPSGFSAADIMMGYSLMLAERVGISDPSLNRLGEYFSMLKARSHYQTAASA